MSKTRTFVRNIVEHTNPSKLNTPSAIIVGAIIIAASIIAYGYIVRPIEKEVRDLVKEVAKDMKLKGSEWEQCLVSPATAEAVALEYNRAAQAGVTGTPTTYILAKRGAEYKTVTVIEGAQSEEYVRAALDQALSGKGETTAFAGDQIGSNEFVQGTRGDVIILEYADIECPYCMRFHPTINAVMNDYQDRVGFVFRHFPLSQIHPNANRYAAAVECAGNLKGPEAYFTFMDGLYQKEIQIMNGKAAY